MYGTWFATADSCPRVMQVIWSLYNSLEKGKSAEDLALEERVRKDIGAEVNGNLPLADAIRCQQQYGLPNGFGWDDAFASQVREYAWRTFMKRYELLEYNSLLLSEMTPELLQALDPRPRNDRNSSEIDEQGTAPKLTVFLGHDAVPMLPLLLGLGVWDRKWPDYASLLALETLHCPQTDEYFVRCVYNHEEKAVWRWDDFVAMLRHQEVDYSRACTARGSAPIRDVCAEAPEAALLRGAGGFGAHRIAARGKGGALSWHGLE